MEREFNTDPDNQKRLKIIKSALDFFIEMYKQADPDWVHGNLIYSIKYLDKEGGYYLVPIFRYQLLSGVVQLNEDILVESSALIKDPESVLIIPVETAITYAKKQNSWLVDFQKPYLGWKPCRESFSSLSPFWVIPHNNGNIYVTQNGNVTESLTAGYGG